MTAPTQPNPNAFIGKRTGYVFAIHFPDYAEIAPFLSEEGRGKFISDLGKAIKNATTGLVCSYEVQETALALLAVDGSPKQTPNVITKTIDDLDKELMTWTGTFGRIGLPLMKFKMGVSKGEMSISPMPPRISGPTLAEALEIAKVICPEFDFRLAASGELVRASTDSVKWIDLDDWQFQTPNTGGRITRIFSKFSERLEPEDVQLFKAARKSYFLQNWDEAVANFDRLSRIGILRTFASVYQKRIQTLANRPKASNWDGVFRK